MKKIAIVLVLFALVLTACGSLGAKAKDEAKADAEPVIVFQRSGGLAGVSEQWSIYANGKIITQNGAELSVEPAKVTALLTAIQTAGFYELKTSTGIGAGLSSCKDCFTYSLTVNGGEKPNTLTFQEGSKEIPDSILNIIQQINDLVAKPDTQ
jgi:hypothetical protein